MNFNTKAWHWIVLLLLTLAWGSSFILMKRGLVAFESNEVAALRIFIAMLALLPFAFRHFKISNIKYLKYFIAISLLGNFIPAFLFTKAQTGISSSLSGMLNSLTPLFTLLIGIIAFKATANNKKVLGIIIGLIGSIGLVIYKDTKNIFSTEIYYPLLVVLATLFYGTSINIYKRFLSTSVHHIEATIWAFLFIGIVSGIYLVYLDVPAKIIESVAARESLAYISILAIINSALSNIVFYWLVKNSNVLFASTITYLIPIVAIGWGLMDGESIYIQQLFSIVIVLIGVYMVNKN